MTEQTEITKKRTGIRILLGISVLFILMIACACIFAAKLFDNVQMKLDRPSGKESPFIPFTVMQKGQQNLELMQKANPMTVARLQYSDDEFNYLLRTMIFSNILQQENNKRISAKRTSIVLEKGIIKIKHIADTPGNPFGKYLNIALELKVSIRNGIDSIEVVSAKAGAFNIPEKMVKEKINDLLARHYRGTAQEQMIQDCVTVLRMDEKGFFLEYKPYPLIRHIDRIYFGGSGIFLRQTGHGSEKK